MYSNLQIWVEINSSLWWFSSVWTHSQFTFMSFVFTHKWCHTPLFVLPSLYLAQHFQNQWHELTWAKTRLFVSTLETVWGFLQQHTIYQLAFMTSHWAPSWQRSTISVKTCHTFTWHNRAIHSFLFLSCICPKCSSLTTFPCLPPSFLLWFAVFNFLSFLSLCQFAHCLTITLPLFLSALVQSAVSPSFMSLIQSVCFFRPPPVSFPHSIHSSSLTDSELRNSDRLYNRAWTPTVSPTPTLLPSKPPSLHLLAARIKSHPAWFQRVESTISLLF